MKPPGIIVRTDEHHKRSRTAATTYHATIFKVGLARVRLLIFSYVHLLPHKDPRLDLLVLLYTGAAAHLFCRETLINSYTIKDCPQASSVASTVPSLATAIFFRWIEALTGFLASKIRSSSSSVRPLVSGRKTSNSVSLNISTGYELDFAYSRRLWSALHSTR